MKCTESWLREWTNPKISLEKLCDKLTMSGFEVEEVAAVAKADYAEHLATKYLKDNTVEISITPNRGDCLSVRGLAREISAITGSVFKPIAIRPVKVKVKDKLAVKVQAKEACPHYIGRVICDVNVSSKTPDWMLARLISAGLKSINIIVDIANYVMLELGQPLHAFDLSCIEKEINVRMAKKGESITLLDGSIQKLTAETLIIADKINPLAIAGVMGGVDSSVTASTQDIFLESAYFSQTIIARQRQTYQLNSDAAHRFERGVDPSMQNEAIERASQLILEHASGNAGPIIEINNKTFLPKSKTIILTEKKLSQVLGTVIPQNKVAAIFKDLQFVFKRKPNAWSVQVPTYRFDLTIEEDLIEEVARIYGYEHIAAKDLTANLELVTQVESAKDDASIRQCLLDLGYHEIISYSFIDKEHQALLEPELSPLTLQNPITAEMSVMRTSLWPGLINAMLYNQSRQQDRIRLFELGTCFIPKGKQTSQVARIAGLITGKANLEQWGEPGRLVDFFDLKGDLEQLLPFKVDFKPMSHSALHPGQSAAIFRDGKEIGVIGALHPQVLQVLKAAENSIFVFELALDELFKPTKPAIQEVSKFPEIRRDIAILIKQTIPATKIQDTIRDVVGTWLKDVFVFDVYAGKNIAPGLRSIALALILQHPTRTLVDEEVVTLMDRVTTVLKEQLGAELRS